MNVPLDQLKKDPWAGIGVAIAMMMQSAWLVCHIERLMQHNTQKFLGPIPGIFSGKDLG